MRIVQVVEVYGFLEVSLLAGFVFCCAPAPPPKPKPKPCKQPKNTAALIFNTADVTQSDTEFGYNNSAPGQSPQSVGECHCKSGATEYYYKGSHDTNWLDYLDGSQPLVMTLTCGSRGVNGSKDMCVCVSDNECYRPDRGGMTASFAPFCTKDDGCHMYMFIAGPPHSEFVRCRGGGSVIPVNVQFLPIGAPRPLPDSYLKIKSITCNGCNHRVSTTCTPA